MTRPERVGPLPTPADVGPSTGGRTLPPDLLREASDRLGVMALLGAALWFTGALSYHLVVRSLLGPDSGWNRLQLFDAIALGAIGVSLLLHWYIRSGQRDPKRVLDLGLGYLILGALGVALVWHLTPAPMEGRIEPTITWIGAMVLMFAGLVPSPPGKTAVVGLVAVSMNPVGMLIARAKGIWAFDSVGDVFLMHYPDYMVVGAAAVVSHVVTRLGHQVAKAREMGAYQIEELLGRGGMGEVYRATHRLLARPAAIKLIRAEGAGQTTPEARALAVQRFRREAQVAAGLRSPHTVELYDFGVTEEGTLYFVMELLEGMNLDELVRAAGPLPANRVIHILRQVCESLEEAHVGGLVHRDIKPANIHIGRLGLRHDFVKVLDFGLVKSVRAAGGEQLHQTAAEVIPGTPAYLAPELALGEAIDGRADLYALGCVGYYLLAGRPVFDAESTLQLIARHLHAEPVPPSAAAGVAVPIELERLVLRCLAKKPDGRPESAASLARALDAIELPRWTESDARDWWRRHPAPRAATEPADRGTT